MNEKEYKHIKTNTNPNDLNINNYIYKDTIIKKKFRCNCKLICCIICFILIFILIGFILFYFFSYYSISKNESVKEKKATIEELITAKYNTVIKLNDLKLDSFKSNYIYNTEHLNSFYNFSIDFFELINYTDFSPISLYSVLINLYMSISDKEESEKLNEILELNHDERLIFYNQIFQNNYFSNSDGEVKISNGAFYNSDNVIENITFIEEFTKTYTECYKLSYKEDFNFILDWINLSIKEKNFVDKKSFKDNNNISMLLISSLYYKQKWRKKFADSYTYKDKFYIDNNKYKEVYFMRHSYSVDYYYDYDTYISFYDFYSNEYLIQYLIPKSNDEYFYHFIKDYNSNILNLIKDTNFLEENESNLKYIDIIDLSVPKFKKESEIDFVPVLKKLGLEKLFNKHFSTVENPFIIEKEKNYYTDKIFQKNKIEFNEDGTIIKSTSLVSNSITSPRPPKKLEIKLNQPFIYIIKDKNKLPIYIGYMIEPIQD